MNIHVFKTELGSTDMRPNRSLSREDARQQSRDLSRNLNGMCCPETDNDTISSILHSKDSIWEGLQTG
jgi:hypothetical protein